MTGIIYDTASVSSMHAIAAAREGAEQRIREDGMSGRPDLPLLRIYISEQAHSSIEKGVITLGLGQRALRKIPTDSDFRMDVHALAAAIEEDKRAGYLPFCVVATVGTTSMSSIAAPRFSCSVGMSAEGAEVGVRFAARVYVALLGSPRKDTRDIAPKGGPTSASSAI